MGFLGGEKWYVEGSSQHTCEVYSVEKYGELQYFWKVHVIKNDAETSVNNSPSQQDHEEEQYTV